MKPTSISEQDAKYDECARLCREAGIEVEYCTVTWAGEDPRHPEGRVLAKFL